MEYTTLGRTGVQVSRICLGCMSYGSSKWRPWVLDEAESMPFFRAAVEAGINFFDTANMYSIGESEVVTGKALREYANRDEVVIATKVFFPMTGGPNMMGLSRKNVQQACDASLKRLGVDCIDLYQIHRLDTKTPIDEMLAGLDSLVQAGKVRYLGASSMYAWQFAQCLERADHRGLARFETMQNHYNLIYREEEREMMPLCASEGVASIPWSPLARGLLAGSRKALKDPEATTRSGSDPLADALYQQDADWDVVEAVISVAKDRGVEPAQVALAWLLSKPAVAAPIVGATKIHHLEAALGAIELELSNEEIGRLEAPYQPHPVRGH
jgi:aryl-alcohol dehydrogenase-like predicted oxidoreductase